MNVDSEAQVARREIGETARRVLTGSLSFIEGARRIVGSCASFDLSSAPSMMESVQDQREGLAQPLLSLIKRALMRCR
jgi:hypothetical protein